MTEKVRVGLVGVANHGVTIGRAIHAAGNLELAVCYDIDAAATRRTAEEYGARPAESFEAVVADPAVEAIVLVTPNHLHAEQTRLAALAGKHVFVEKPIALNVAEGKRMIGQMREAGRLLFVGHNTRRRRAFRRARALLEEGALGRVVAMEGNLSRPVGLLPGLPAWKADPATCPLLPMTQLGIHLVDTAAYLDSPVRRVSCMAANRAMPRGVPDTCLALLELESGVLCTLSSFYVTPDAYFLRVYGTEGVLHCEPTHLRLERIQNGSPAGSVETDFPDEGAQSYISQMREFGECVRTGQEPETGGEAGLHAVAVIEAMGRSAASGVSIDMRDLLS